MDSPQYVFPKADEFDSSHLYFFESIHAHPLRFRFAKFKFRLPITLVILTGCYTIVFCGKVPGDMLVCCDKPNIHEFKINHLRPIRFYLSLFTIEF